MILRRSLVLRTTISPSRTFTHRSTSNKQEQWLDDIKRRVKTWSDVEVRERAKVLALQTRINLSKVGTRLNEVTGYDTIEGLKRSVVQREQEIATLKQEARDAKRAYEAAVTERSSCQRQVNDLLQRKSSWSESDVSRFTALVRQDHLNEQEEIRAKERADSAELRVESEFNELMRAILNRYHEEQIWSDKIRSASTYGSLAALGLNLVVFILAIVVVEPYKRKRLGETFEKRMVVMEKENQELMKNGMQSLTEHFEKQEHVLARLAAISLTPIDHDPSPIETAPPETYSETIISEARTLRSLQDARVLSAAAGAVGGVLLMYLFGR